MHVNLLQHCVQAIDVSINLAITLQWTFTDTSTPKRAKQSSNYNYFGRRVSVLFDDGKKYVGVIIGKDPKGGKWITRFEDGSEDKCDDPAVDDDYTLIND